MALGSRIHILGSAVAATLNADLDLAGYGFEFRKKPYNRGRMWSSGGWVCPLQTETPYHENVQDEAIYRFLAVVSDPADADLTAGMADHLGAIERVEAIFRNKSHGFMPATIRTTAQATLDAAVAAGKFAACQIQGTDVTWAQPFVDGAFEAGYDASSCIVSVRVLMSRRDSTAL
jgi:hypothetical protein